MTKRYVIMNGKWGSYFRDRQEKKDLTLADTCTLLNENDKLQKENQDFKEYIANGEMQVSVR